MGRISALGMVHSLEAQAVLLAAEFLETSVIEGKILDSKSVRSSMARRIGLPYVPKQIEQFLAWWHESQS